MKKRGIKRMIHLINRFIAKKVVANNIKQREDILKNLDKSEEKLFELFKAVLKHHSHISKYDGYREVSDNLTSILLTDAGTTSETYIMIKKKDGTLLEFFINNKKASIFKEEFDKAIKRMSIKHLLEKKKGMEKHLDDMIEKENKKDKK